MATKLGNMGKSALKSLLVTVPTSIAISKMGLDPSVTKKVVPAVIGVGAAASAASSLGTDVGHEAADYLDARRRFRYQQNRLLNEADMLQFTNPVSGKTSALTSGIYGFSAKNTAASDSGLSSYHANNMKTEAAWAQASKDQARGYARTVQLKKDGGKALDKLVRNDAHQHYWETSTSPGVKTYKSSVGKSVSKKAVDAKNWAAGALEKGNVVPESVTKKLASSNSAGAQFASGAIEQLNVAPKRLAMRGVDKLDQFTQNHPALYMFTHRQSKAFSESVVEELSLETQALLNAVMSSSDRQLQFERTLLMVPEDEKELFIKAYQERTGNTCLCEGVTEGRPDFSTRQGLNAHSNGSENDFSEYPGLSSALHYQDFGLIEAITSAADNKVVKSALSNAKGLRKLGKMAGQTNEEIQQNIANATKSVTDRFAKKAEEAAKKAAEGSKEAVEATKTKFDSLGEHFQKAARKEVRRGKAWEREKNDPLTNALGSIISDDKEKGARIVTNAKSDLGHFIASKNRKKFVMDKVLSPAQNNNTQQNQIN